MLLAKQPVWEATFAHRLFPTRSDLVCKFETLRKRVTSATTRNSRIVKSFPGQPRISIRKLPSGMKNTPTASVRGTVSHEPKLAFAQVRNFKKEGIASFPRYQDSQNSTSGATSAMRRKIDKNKGTMLKISQFSPRGCRVRAQILSDPQRFDPQVHNFKKEDTFKHNVQLSDHQDFPRSSWNLNRKITFWRPLFAGPYLSSPNSISRKSETLRKKVSQAF